jgi:hypothetical protein
MPRRLIAGRRRVGGPDGLRRPSQSVAFLLLIFAVWVTSPFVLAGRATGRDHSRLAGDLRGGGVRRPPREARLPLSRRAVGLAGR